MQECRLLEKRKKMDIYLSYYKVYFRKYHQQKLYLDIQIFRIDYMERLRKHTTII